MIYNKIRCGKTVCISYPTTRLIHWGSGKWLVEWMGPNHLHRPQDLYCPILIHTVNNYLRPPLLSPLLTTTLHLCIIVNMTALLLYITTLYALPNCGIEPIPPINCSNGTPTCVCSADGDCKWVYIDCTTTSKPINTKSSGINE